MAPFIIGVTSLVAGLTAYGLWHGEALPPAIVMHATLMTVAWGVLMPIGAIAARYFKVTPAQDYPAEVDNLFWWTWHRVLQYGGLALATGAIVAIVTITRGVVGTLHGMLGLLAMLLGWLQVLAALLRGTKGGPTDKGADAADPASWHGDHYDMTRRRLLFEAWHKRAGWATILLANGTLLLGIQLIGAPAWAMLLAGTMQGAVLAGVIDGRLRRRWVDTYAAIWGPDAVHPGNRRSRPHGADPASAHRRGGPGDRAADAVTQRQE